VRITFKEIVGRGECLSRGLDPVSEFEGLVRPLDGAPHCKGAATAKIVRKHQLFVQRVNLRGRASGRRFDGWQTKFRGRRYFAA
jgi:hypothetical protein